MNITVTANHATTAAKSAEVISYYESNKTAAISANAAATILFAYGRREGSARAFALALKPNGVQAATLVKAIQREAELAPTVDDLHALLDFVEVAAGLPRSYGWVTGCPCDKPGCVGPSSRRCDLNA